MQRVKKTSIFITWIAFAIITSTIYVSVLGSNLMGFTLTAGVVVCFLSLTKKYEFELYFDAPVVDTLGVVFACLMIGLGVFVRINSGLIGYEGIEGSSLYFDIASGGSDVYGNPQNLLSTNMYLMLLRWLFYLFGTYYTVGIIAQVVMFLTGITCVTYLIYRYISRSTALMFLMFAAVFKEGVYQTLTYNENCLILMFISAMVLIGTVIYEKIRKKKDVMVNYIIITLVSIILLAGLWGQFKGMDFNISAENIYKLGSELVYSIPSGFAYLLIIPLLAMLFQSENIKYIISIVAIVILALSAIANVIPLTQAILFIQMVFLFMVVVGVRQCFPRFITNNVNGCFINEEVIEANEEMEFIPATRQEIFIPKTMEIKRRERKQQVDFKIELNELNNYFDIEIKDGDDFDL